MKKVLLILGHPDKDSLNGKLANIFEEGVKDKKHDFRRINLGDLRFDFNLSKGYKEEKELEPDLVKSQECILWADVLVFVFPVWWHGLPAILKGFIDRVFLPGFAFKYNNSNGSFPDKLLKGKKSFLICTSGGPNIYYFFAGNLATKTLKRVFSFCGIKNRKTLLLGSSSVSIEKINLKRYQIEILKIVNLI